MRYVTYRFKGEPADQPPCGMNDIVGYGDYQSPKNAAKYLRVTPVQRQKLLEQGYTHLGIYSRPHDYRQPDKLEKTIRL